MRANNAGLLLIYEVILTPTHSRWGGALGSTLGVSPPPKWSVASCPDHERIERNRPAIRHVLSSQILFSPVRRPWDSRRSTPDLLTLSTYGIAALVAGGIAAKLGFFKGLWVALFAAKKFIIIGIIALVVAIKKFFGKGKNVTES